MAQDKSRASSADDAFCRSAGAHSLSRGNPVPKPEYPFQRLPGFESGHLDKVTVGEIVGWRWWKVIDRGFFTFNGSKPIPRGPFMADFHTRGGMVAFKRREDAERMFEKMRAAWNPDAVTFQSELPPDAPRVAPDAYCLSSVELWGSIYEYERGYLGQFVCVRSVDLVIGNASLTALREKYCLGSC